MVYPTNQGYKDKIYIFWKSTKFRFESNENMEVVWFEYDLWNIDLVLWNNIVVQAVKIPL